MASQHRKHRGYATERIVAMYLQQWWSAASVGRGQGEDILNVPFDIEIKARNSLDIKGTLRQIKARTDKSGKLGFACFSVHDRRTGDAMHWCWQCRLATQHDRFHIWQRVLIRFAGVSIHME